MTVLIFGMLVTLLLAGVVVAAVAVPAFREGRDVLSPEGEQLMQSALDRTVEAVGTAREKVGDRVGDLAERLPSRSADADATPATVGGVQEIDLRDTAVETSVETSVTTSVEGSAESRTEAAERRHRA